MTKYKTTGQTAKRQRVLSKQSNELEKILTDALRAISALVDHYKINCENTQQFKEKVNNINVLIEEDKLKTYREDGNLLM